MSLEGVGKVSKAGAVDQEESYSAKLIKRGDSLSVNEGAAKKGSAVADANDLNLLEKNASSPIVEIKTQIRVYQTTGLAKNEQKEVQSLLKIVDSKGDLRTKMQDLEKLINDSKNPGVKNLAEDYRQLMVREVFPPKPFSSVNIREFVDNFKAATEHKQLIGDGNKNIKNLYTALEQLKAFVLTSAGDYSEKVAAFAQVKTNAEAFINTNPDSSKIGWVKELLSKLNTNPVFSQDQQIKEQKKQNLSVFASEAKQMGKTFSVLNDFSAKFMVEMAKTVGHKFSKEQELLREFGNQLGKMDNKEFIQLHQETKSDAFTAFREKLATATDETSLKMLECLNNFQTMVYTEFAEKGLQDKQKLDKIGALPNLAELKDNVMFSASIQLETIAFQQLESLQEIKSSINFPEN